MKTSNPQDLSQTFPGFGYDEQIFDCYDAVKNITKEIGGRAKLNYHIETNLPIISDNKEFIHSQLTEFLFSSFEKVKGQAGFVIVSYVKDPNFWIFKFSLKNQLLNDTNYNPFEESATACEFILEIHKKSNHYTEDSPAAIILL